MGKFNLLRRIKNHMYYTVCMEGNEEAVNVFRVCSNRAGGILCYEQLNIERLKLIKIKDREYLICPKAVKFWDEEDLREYRLKD